MLNEKGKPAVIGCLRSKRSRPSIMWLAQQTHGQGSDVILEVQNGNCRLNILIVKTAFTPVYPYLLSGNDNPSTGNGLSRSSIPTTAASTAIPLSAMYLMPPPNITNPNSL